MFVGDVKGRTVSQLNQNHSDNQIHICIDDFVQILFPIFHFKIKINISRHFFFKFADDSEGFFRVSSHWPQATTLKMESIILLGIAALLVWFSFNGVRISFHSKACSDELPFLIWKVYKSSGFEHQQPAKAWKPYGKWANNHWSLQTDLIPFATHFDSYLYCVFFSSPSGISIMISITN